MLTGSPFVNWNKKRPIEWTLKENRPRAKHYSDIHTLKCNSVVEHWSSNPEDAGSIPSRKALELHFSQLVPVWVW